MKPEMKITVCFGATKIVVPCGTQLPVRELIQKAVVRYKKVTHKHADDYIRVQCLQTCDEEAILDEDDMVGDVLDDKDKVIASYEENLVSRPGHNGGDGTSTSSVGTASPDIFQGEINLHSPIEGVPVSNSVGDQQKKTTDDHKPTNSSVKYVDSFSPISSPPKVVNADNKSKNRHSLEGRTSSIDTEGYEGSAGNNNDNNEKSENEPPVFKREAARKSLKSDHLDRWINLQESYYEYERHEPTGASLSPDDKYDASELASLFGRQMSLSLSETDETEHINIVLKPTMGENLGITVQGYQTADGRELGLIVFQIDPKGCAARDGRVQVADRIVAVNSQDLTNISNERAEEAFSKALQCGSIELGISRSHSFIPENIVDVNNKRTMSVTSSKDESEAEYVEEEERNTLSPLRHFSNSPRGEILTPKNKSNDMVPRIVEKTIFIDLMKGSGGLGFSVTSRDNPTAGNCPIYVKNILPHGAAINDGRLQAGDQIIQVDGVEMTGKTQEEAVTMLRRTTGEVKLQIQRRVTVTSPIGSSKLIKDLERAPSDNRGNKILTYRIPLPSSGTAGLGITVKGKSSGAEQNENGDDLGIFIKSIVPGGAAQLDGRLRPDDQLISVNGVKLTGMSNSSAMKTLRSAMEGDNIAPSVEVTVIRSVTEIKNTVSDLETIKEQKCSNDRGIDVGKSGHQYSLKNDEGQDVTDSPALKENKSNRIRKSKGNVPNVIADITEFETILDQESKEIKTSTETIVEDEFSELSRRKLPLEDEVTELKSRKIPTKLGSGVHRNPSYYIAMNRSGQRERNSKSKRPMKRTPFYQPHVESLSKSDQNIEITRPQKEERPQKVIASYIDVVATPTRAFCISSRPTSTVAEPTPPLSTTAPTTSPRSVEANAEKPRDRTFSNETNTPRSKNPPATLSIPKGTPPPPPPRTSRPSPYAKQFPNYLPVNALRKTDNTLSDYSNNSGVSSPFQSPRGNTNGDKVISAKEVKPKTRREHKTNSPVQQEKPSKQETCHKDSLTDDEGGTEENFLREGFGRQSMSEKRFKLVQADITQTEFYKQRVTRSRSLEGANHVNNVGPAANNIQAQTLPRPSSTSSDKGKKRKSKEDYNEKLIDSTNVTKDVVKDVHVTSHTLRGQWRTSSDGVVKKYGHHGNYIRASPLVTSVGNNGECSGAVHSDSGGEAIPITMQSNADYNSVHPKVKKKQSPFNLKVLGQALKPKAHKGKYDMSSPQDSPSEPTIETPDEQRYRQLLGVKQRERSSSDTTYRSKYLDLDDGRSSSKRRKDELTKRSSPASIQEFIRKGSGEYSITESAQI